jgi:hypothetical protein
MAFRIPPAPSLRGLAAAALLLPAAASPTLRAQPASVGYDGTYAGTLTETWRHPEMHCPWASPRPSLTIAGGRAALRFHHDPPWEATGRIEPGGRMRLEFGRGTEIDVEVVGAVEHGAFRGILRTRACAFALELVRR